MSLPARPTWFRWLAWTLILAAGAALLAYRRPDALQNPQVWAEDVIVFHAQAESLGWRSLFVPHAGYFHTWPRIVALGAQAVDPLYLPWAYNYSAWLIAAAVFAALLRVRTADGGGVGPIWAAAFLFTPHYSGEIFLALTNVQWVLTPFLVASVLRRPPEGGGPIALSTTAVLLAATTTPFSVILAPLAAWAGLIRRSPGSWFVNGALLAGALAQLLAIHFTSVPYPSQGWATWSYYLQNIGFRVGIETFVPERWWPTATGWHSFAGLVVLTLFITLGTVAGPRRWERAALALAIAGFLLATYVRSKPFIAEMQDAGWGDRYFFAIRLLLVWQIVCFAWRAGRRQWALLVLLLVPLAAASRYRAGAWPDYRWADYAPALRRGEAVQIPINPSGWIYHYAGRRDEAR